MSGGRLQFFQHFIFFSSSPKLRRAASNVTGVTAVQERAQQPLGSELTYRGYTRSRSCALRATTKFSIALAEAGLARLKRRGGKKFSEFRGSLHSPDTLQPAYRGKLDRCVYSPANNRFLSFRPSASRALKAILRKALSWFGHDCIAKAGRWRISRARGAVNGLDFAVRKRKCQERRRF
jgi:hypothetical protein